MAEEKQQTGFAAKNDDGVLDDVGQLLAGHPVPVNTVHFQRKEAMKHKPKTKVTVGYIVMTVMFDEKGKVLLVQEAKKSCRGQWYLPAGRLEQNETMVEGAKREVKEEAGLECDITTLLHVDFASSRWSRHSYYGVQSGGKLKTLEEADEESLQAEFFDVKAVLNGLVNLRSRDILSAIQQGVAYRESLEGTPLHPPLLPALAPHTHLLHRVVIAATNTAGDRFWLLAAREGRRTSLITTAISPHDNSLRDTLHIIMQGALSENHITWNMGILGVEHDGRKESGGLDGVCFTSLVSMTLEEGAALLAPRAEEFVWVETDRPLLLEALHRAMKGFVLPLIEQSKTVSLVKFSSKMKSVPE